MSLYDKMLNIANIPKESIIEKAILKTKEELNGLDYERMYNYYLTKVTNNKDINITIDDSIFKKTSKFKK